VAKTNTEIIRELEKNDAILIERIDNLRGEVARLEKQIEEVERRYATLMMAFVGAFFALLGGLVLALVRK
jgi:hypothetical protein